MFPSSTPSITLEFDESFDLSKVVKIELTIKSDKPIVGKFNRTFGLDDVLVDLDENTMTLQLSQEDTIDLKGTETVALQVKYKLDNDMVDYTNKVTLQVEDVLKVGIL